MYPAAISLILIGVPAHKATPQGHENDSEVEGEAPVLQVVKVVPNAPLDGCVTAKAVHLGPAGDSNVQMVPRLVGGDFSSELPDEMGSLRPRPNDAHLSLQDIEELR